MENRAKPQVGIIMGSQSDLRIMGAAAKILDEFGVDYEIKVVSAHRTPKRIFEYGESAKDRGIQVIIAGAGGAAHLPGMMASVTSLPVIGVPIKLQALDGLDAMLSIVQMPRGVPVATVGIDNAKNAGLLALRILASNSDSLYQALLLYQKKMSEQVGYDLEESYEREWGVIR